MIWAEIWKNIRVFFFIWKFSIVEGEFSIYLKSEFQLGVIISKLLCFSVSLYVNVSCSSDISSGYLITKPRISGLVIWTSMPPNHLGSVFNIYLERITTCTSRENIVQKVFIGFWLLYTRPDYMLRLITGNTPTNEIIEHHMKSSCKCCKLSDWRSGGCSFICIR